MDLSTYFEPVNLTEIDYQPSQKLQTIGDHIQAYTSNSEFPAYRDADLAIIGLTDDRNAVGNKGCGSSPNTIRHFLYRLASPVSNINVVDFGNLIPGHTCEDSYYAATEVLYKLIENNVTVILIGAGQDFTFAAYKAYEILGRIINICDVDARLDIGSGIENNSRSFIGHIVMENPNYLFDFSLMAYQSYFEAQENIQLLHDLKFDYKRLGMIQQDIDRAEPMVRNADLITVDIGAVRMSDAPGNANPSPHGLYGEELCQITRFAGMSAKNSCIGFHEVNPHFDNRGQTSHLVAHTIWYYIDGYYNRVYDEPEFDKINHKRYTVELQNYGMKITFHKSKKTDRWWMEVPCDDLEKQQRYIRHILVPCNYSDYEQAMENQIPDLWWHVYHKIDD